jgi:hypothetical protein
MRADQLQVGRHYAMRRPGRGRGMQVVQLRHFLSRATGNVIVREVTEGESHIVSPADLWYEVAPSGDGSGRWTKLGNRTLV